MLGLDITSRLIGGCLSDLPRKVLYVMDRSAFSITGRHPIGDSIMGSYLSAEVPLVYSKAQAKGADLLLETRKQVLSGNP